MRFQPFQVPPFTEPCIDDTSHQQEYQHIPCGNFRAQMFHFHDRIFDLGVMLHFITILLKCSPPTLSRSAGCGRLCGLPDTNLPPGMGVFICLLFFHFNLTELFPFVICCKCSFHFFGCNKKRNLVEVAELREKVSTFPLNRYACTTAEI